MSTILTYADILQPARRGYAAAYNAALILIGSVVIGLCAQIAVYLPFSPVPVTGQTFAVLMAGPLLGRRRAVLCVLAYLTEGLLGLPVFAMGRAGLPTLIGPTGGYLVGFAAAAYLTGALAEKQWDRRLITTALAMVLGNTVIYCAGWLWLSCLTNARTAFIAGVLPFVPGDILKIVLAVAFLPAGWILLGKTGAAKTTTNIHQFLHR